MKKLFLGVVVAFCCLATTGFATEGGDKDLENRAAEIAQIQADRDVEIAGVQFQAFTDKVNAGLIALGGNSGDARTVGQRSALEEGNVTDILMIEANKPFTANIIGFSGKDANEIIKTIGQTMKDTDFRIFSRGIPAENRYEMITVLTGIHDKYAELFKERKTGANGAEAIILSSLNNAIVEIAFGAGYYMGDDLPSEEDLPGDSGSDSGAGDDSPSDEESSEDNEEIQDLERRIEEARKRAANLREQQGDDASDDGQDLEDTDDGIDSVILYSMIIFIVIMCGLIAFFGLSLWRNRE